MGAARDRAADATRVTACTIVARNYVPAAAVLARSYLDHNPTHGFAVAVIDLADRSDAGDLLAVGGVSVLGPDDLGLPAGELHRMATAYSVTELATAVKPTVLRTLSVVHDVVVYLDPDITVFGPLDDVVAKALEHDVVLTPHTLGPMPRDGRQPSEQVIMGTGVFNLGFVAVGPGATGFLDWWAERLRHDAVIAPAEQLFTDQRWIDYVPSLFRHHVLRDPACNVAYWNLHERELTRCADGYPLVDGRPLVFFHFSGYRPDAPWLLSYHCARRPRVLLSREPVVRELCDGYGAALQDAGWSASGGPHPYGYGTLSDGFTLTGAVRAAYRTEWVDAERSGRELPPPAFGPGAEPAFVEWLTAPVSSSDVGTAVNRLTAAVWARRGDLQAAFPAPSGQDAVGFAHWCMTSGVAEDELPAWAVPERLPEPVGGPRGELGVNVVGYHTAELGIGQMGRILLDAVRASGVPHAAQVEERSVSNRTGLPSPDSVGHPVHPVTVLCVNADQTRTVAEAHPEAFRDRYLIGLWAWEVEDFPERMHEGFDLVDEVWTVSEYCREVLQRHTATEVRVFPAGIDLPPAAPAVTTGTTRFLFAFDFNSGMQRKNPLGVVRAFLDAFPVGDEDAELVVKATNGDLHIREAEELRSAVAADHRTSLVEDYLSVAELDDLYAASSCYVSLHRSEGFGLTVAEAMSHGLPVIATDYAGTRDFVPAGAGWLVPHRTTRVGERGFPYEADGRWAEPDHDAAVLALREVAADRPGAAERGAQGRAHLAATRTPEHAADWVATNLRRAHETWAQRRRTTAGAGTTTGTGTPPPLSRARAALTSTADPASASTLRLARPLRRAVLRVLDHYDAHRREVASTVLGDVASELQRLEQTLVDLRGTVEQVELTQARDRRALRSAERDVARVRDECARDLGATVVRLEELQRSTAAAGEHGRASAAHLAVLTERVDEQAVAARSVHERAEQHSRQLEATAVRVDDHVRSYERATRARDRTVAAVDQHTKENARHVELVEVAVARAFAPVPPGTTVAFCDAGALLLPRDEVVLPWIRHHGCWEPDEAALLGRLADGGLFLDVGAHVGYHTLRLLGENGRVDGVVAVEADAHLSEILRANLRRNLDAAVHDLVVVENVAAWDSDGPLDLVVGDPGNSGDHRVGGPHQAGGTTVPGRRLDGLPAVSGARVGLVKTDLQGADHRALRGLAAVLRRDRPHVVCEFSPQDIQSLGDDPLDVLRGYHEWGYRVRLVDGQDVTDDAGLVAATAELESGFATLWLDRETP